MERILSLAIVLASFAFAPAAESPRKPNIVVILADDIGYGDLGCYGATKVKTPNLDRLAKDGRRFTDAHSPAATCTPTRRALLTGAYSWRQQPGSLILPGDAPLCIPPGTPTVPSLLKKAGYTTGVVGKWHLGLGDKPGGPDWNADLKPGPLDIGFDHAFIMPATGDRVPCVYVEDRRVVGLDPKDPIKISYKEKVGSEPTGKENPDRLTLKPTRGHDMTIVNGVSRIGWMAGGTAARWKDEEMSDTFAKKAVAFIEKNKGGPFFLYFATHGIHVPRVPHPRFKGSTTLGARGDAIQELDDAVGTVLKALDQHGLTNNTLIVFTSDNGGIVDDGYQDFANSDHKPNGVLNGGKGSLLEGGHRVPFIARWPGVIEPGSTSAALIAHLDFAATFAALTGVPLPAGAGPDSFDVRPALLGTLSEAPGRPHFLAHTGGTAGPLAVRQGDWKLIAPGPKANPPQLFNLKDDLGEKTNLAAKHPEKVAELTALIDRLRDAKRSRPDAK